jgi:hypothetical protein
MSILDYAASFTGGLMKFVAAIEWATEIKAKHFVAWHGDYFRISVE